MLEGDCYKRSHSVANEKVVSNVWMSKGRDARTDQKLGRNEFRTAQRLEWVVVSSEVCGVRRAIAKS